MARMDLRVQGDSAHHVRQQVNSVGMKPQLRLIEDEGPRQARGRLQEERGQADETQCAIGEGVGPKSMSEPRSCHSSGSSPD